MSALLAVLLIAVVVGVLRKHRRDRALRGGRGAAPPSAELAPANRSWRPPSLPIWARPAPPLAYGDLRDRRPGQSARDKAQEQRELRRAQQAAGEPVTADPRRWDEGAKGEEEVGLELLRLPAGEWLVLHDIPVGHHDANIDHLVVGPGGVFSLNTKRLGGAVRVGAGDVLHNGTPTGHIGKALCEARRATDLLTKAAGETVTVQPILVFAGTVPIGPDHLEGVAIATTRSIVRRLAATPLRLSPLDVDVIWASAVQRATWIANAGGWTASVAPPPTRLASPQSSLADAKPPPKPTASVQATGQTRPAARRLANAKRYRLTLQYDTTCTVCSSRLLAGGEGWRDPRRRLITCGPCNRATSD